MNRNYGLCGTRSSCRTVFCQPVDSVHRSVAFVGPAISCQDGRSTYGPLALPTAVGVMTLITRQCFAIPTSSLEIVRSTEKARRAPTGCASEKQKRSDLICDRETSCPPASSPSPLFPPRRISTTFESTSFRTLFVFPTSLAFPPLRALPTCSSSSSSPLSSLVVHESPRALNLSPQLNIAFASRYRPLHLDFASLHLQSPFFPRPTAFFSFSLSFIPIPLIRFVAHVPLILNIIGIALL
ncbi:hypothetical protein ALC60_14671 [Trachymyrmex zeteki]|uniref:Uncharacterized protein n=1 Tax=Mycetomoellerius zeteki TaxID=64791 RepID=A0A151WEG2_9HYME|nr:hypothetical protein ALC60_14671 [Trachymyrmex zeteki]